MTQVRSTQLKLSCSDKRSQRGDEGIYQSAGGLPWQGVLETGGFFAEGQGRLRRKEEQAGERP